MVRWVVPKVVVVLEPLLCARLVVKEKMYMHMYKFLLYDLNASSVAGFRLIDEECLRELFSKQSGARSLKLN